MVSPRALAALVVVSSALAFAQGAPAQNRVPELPGRAPAAPPKREAPAADAKKKNVGGGAKLKEGAADEVVRETTTAPPARAKDARPVRVK
jgi:hypothetical protein